jgi:hypothetical protein
VPRLRAPAKEALRHAGGLLALALLAAAVASLAALGVEDGSPAAAYGAALDARGHLAQLSGFLHALAGLSLASFAWTLASLPPRAGRAFPAWGRFAGLAWAASFIAGGVVLFAAAEMAGHHEHPEGAKTALLLGHLLYANPIAALLGGALAVAVGHAASPAWPAWFPRLSLVLGSATAAATLLGAVGGIGLVSLGPLALWTLAAALLAPWRAARSG